VVINQILLYKQPFTGVHFKNKTGIQSVVIWWSERSETFHLEDKYSTE